MGTKKVDVRLFSVIPRYGISVTVRSVFLGYSLTKSAFSTRDILLKKFSFNDQVK